MEPLILQKLDKKVLRVTLVKREADGTRISVPVYDEIATTLLEPRKKQTGVFKFAEKKTRRGARRGLRMIDYYLALHERSNRKKKNGWAKDYFKNTFKAARKAAEG